PPRGRSRGHDGARPQGGRGTQPLDELSGAGGHLLRVSVLARLVVDPGLDADVLVAVDRVRGDEPGAGWLERVPPFGTHHLEEGRLIELLALARAEVAGADIVGD